MSMNPAPSHRGGGGFFAHRDGERGSCRIRDGAPIFRRRDAGSLGRLVRMVRRINTGLRGLILMGSLLGATWRAGAAEGVATRPAGTQPVAATAPAGVGRTVTPVW